MKGVLCYTFFMENKQHPGLVSWAVAIALIIVINLFFHYVIALVYHEPKFDAFCPAQPVQYMNAESCVGNGGQWTNNQMAPQEITKAIQNGQSIGWCDANFTCQKTYNTAHSIYNRNVFLVLVILSVIVLALGIFIPITVLSLGFSWAGVVSLIIATIEYWSDANNFIKVIILALALGALIWLAIKKMNHKNSPQP